MVNVYLILNSGVHNSHGHRIAVITMTATITEVTEMEQPNNSKLCAGLIFEVSSKTKEEATNNERALMQVFMKYKEINAEGWESLQVNLISLAGDVAGTTKNDTSGDTDIKMDDGGTDTASSSNPFHCLFVFYPKAFELVCHVDDITASSSEQISARWVDLSKARITDDEKKEGVKILEELWNEFKTSLGLEDQKNMPLNVIGITEKSLPAPVDDSSCSSACGSGSCDAMPSGGDGA